MSIKSLYLTFYLLIPKSLEPNTISGISQLINRLLGLNEENH